ncbi:MAG TPA: class C sortase [Lachnospiraceae bacterium]|nr:class C sortase [Lachnospiraceae bacterium]
MRKRWKDIILLLLFLAGVSVLLYPYVARELNDHNQSIVVENYRQNASRGGRETLDAAKKSAEEFNQELYEENNGKFSTIGESLDKLYWKELDFDGDGVMGYLNIPVIGETLPIRHGTSDEVLQNAAGHLESTSLPVGGENTHCVLTGHRGLPSSVLFSNLNLMSIGDQIYLHVLGDTLAYEVDKIETLLPEETQSLNVVPGEDRITLITCTPYGINSHRLLVHARRVPYIAEEEKSTTVLAKTSWTEWVSFGLLALGAVLALMIVILVPRHYRRKREGRNKS